MSNSQSLPKSHINRACHTRRPYRPPHVACGTSWSCCPRDYSSGPLCMSGECIPSQVHSPYRPRYVASNRPPPCSPRRWRWQYCRMYAEVVMDVWHTARCVLLDVRHRILPVNIDGRMLRAACRQLVMLTSTYRPQYVASSTPESCYRHYRPGGPGRSGPKNACSTRSLHRAAHLSCSTPLTFCPLRWRSGAWCRRCNPLVLLTFTMPSSAFRQQYAGILLPSI